MFDQIIDANVNRIGEGLRVIEEYTRFVRSNETLTQKLSSIRKHIHQAFPQQATLLHLPISHHLLHLYYLSNEVRSSLLMTDITSS